MHNIGLHNEKLAAQDIHKRLVPATSNGSKIDRPMDLDQVKIGMKRIHSGQGGKILSLKMTFFLLLFGLLWNL